VGVRDGSVYQAIIFRCGDREKNEIRVGGDPSSPGGTPSLSKGVKPNADLVLEASFRRTAFREWGNGSGVIGQHREVFCPKNKWKGSGERSKKKQSSLSGTFYLGIPAVRWHWGGGGTQMSRAGREKKTASAKPGSGEINGSSVGPPQKKVNSPTPFWFWGGRPTTRSCGEKKRLNTG